MSVLQKRQVSAFGWLGSAETQGSYSQGLPGPRERGGARGEPRHWLQGQGLVKGIWVDAVLSGGNCESPVGEAHCDLEGQIAPGWPGTHLDEEVRALVSQQVDKAGTVASVLSLKDFLPESLIRGVPSCPSPTRNTGHLPGAPGEPQRHPAAAFDLGLVA